MKGVLNRKLLVTLIAVLVVALSCALFVSCKANLYLVSAEYDAGAATVELRDGKGNVAEKIEEGATVTVKVTPNDGYEVTAFKVNGEDKQTDKDGTYTHTVTADTVFSVTFTAKSAAALVAPVITKDGSVVSWTAVEHAAGYEVYVNGAKKADVTECTYTFAETAAGTYTLTVKAKSADNAYLTSAASNEVTFVVGAEQTLTAPVITAEGNVVTWTAVEHATGYEIYLNGTKKATVTNCTYTFAETAAGTYNLTVKAVSGDTAYAASAESNAIKFTVDGRLDALAEALASVQTTFRADGESIHTETGSTAVLNKIVTVFGEGKRTTVESTSLGEILYEDVLVNRDGKLAMPYHTKDNTVDYKLSAEDYALYDNPFKTLTVDDFEATAVPNVFRLTDAAKAKQAASNFTGWTETIDNFLVKIDGGKVVEVTIETAEMHPDENDETFVSKSTYEFVLSQHGTAVVDPAYFLPYAKTADHERLEAALTNAKAAQNYTWRVHEEEDGYEDLDYNIYVTDDMIYIDCEGWQSGYWWTNETVYPFDYKPATDSTASLLTLLDPLADKSFATVCAMFTDGAFHAEMFKCADNNKFVLRDSQYAGDYAFYFADGRDNQKLYLSYVLDLTVTLSPEGNLDTVEFSYYVYGALVKRTLTFTDANNTTIDIDTSNIEYSSVLDDYIGEYVSIDKTHTVAVSEDGILIDGEQFVIEMYSAANSTFVGTVNGEKYYILNMFQKQLVVYNEPENEADRVQYVVTNVNIVTVDIPERYKGMWAATVGEGDDQKLLVLEVFDHSVMMDGLELTVLSYDEYSEVIAMDTSGWTYALWLDLDGLTQDQMYLVIFVNGSRLGGFTLNRFTNLGEDKLPDELIGEFEGRGGDGTECTLRVTDKYVIVKVADGGLALNTALVLNSVIETEDGKQAAMFYSVTNDMLMAVVINGDGTYSLCKADAEGNLDLLAVLERVDPNAVKIPEALQGTFEGTANDGTPIRAEITDRDVTILFNGIKQNVEVKGMEDFGSYTALIVVIDGVEYEISEWYDDSKISVYSQNGKSANLDRVSTTDPDPGDVTINDRFVGTYAGEKNGVKYEVTIGKDSITVKIDGALQTVSGIVPNDFGIDFLLNGDAYNIASNGGDTFVTTIIFAKEDYSLYVMLNRVEQPDPQPSIDIPSKYYGTFKGTDDNGIAYVVVIDETGVYVTVDNGAEIKAVVTDYTVSEGAFELITLTVGEDEVSLMIFNGDGINDGFDVINGFNYSVSGKDVDVNLMRNGGGEQPDPEPGIEIPTDFHGTFTGTSKEPANYTLIITESSIKMVVENSEGTNTYDGKALKVEEKFALELTFAVGDREYIVQYYYSYNLKFTDDNGTLIEVELTLDDGDKPVITDIPESFHGTFTGKNTSMTTNIETDFTVVISADGIEITAVSEGKTHTSIAEVTGFESSPYGDVLTVLYNGKEHTLSLGDGEIYFMSSYDSGNDVYVTLVKNGGIEPDPVEPIVEIPEILRGTFEGNNDGKVFRAVITNSSVTLSIDGVEQNVEIVRIEKRSGFGEYYAAVITVNGEQREIVEGYGGSISVTLDAEGETFAELTKTEEPNPDPAPSITIPEAYYGDYSTEDTASMLSIEQSGFAFVMINEVEAADIIVVSYTEADGFVLTIDGKQATLKGVAGENGIITQLIYQEADGEPVTMDRM